MERIKKALEKAQQERQNVEGQPSVSAAKKNVGIKRDTDKIEYSKTRNLAVNKAKLKENRVIAVLEDDPRADLYKILRTKVLQKMQANNWNVLAVSSPGQGAGKSLTAINLAISIAMDANYSVLLADLDLRHPSLHQYFDMPEAQPGLSNYFEGEKDISELLIHPGLEKLVVLPAGRPIKRSSDLLSTPMMMELAEELKQRYADRVVVVNLPPLLQTDDAMIFMPNVDACVLVVAEGETSIEDVEKSMQMIDKEKFMGTILNKSTDVALKNKAY